MKYIDFSNNLNSIGPANNINKIITDNIDLIYNYPELIDLATTKKIEDHFSIKKGLAYLANGSTEIFFNLPLVLRKGEVTIVGPTFWEYAASNDRIKENKVNFYLTEESNDFLINFKNLSEKIKHSKVVYLCNPNNPTSTLAQRKDLFKIINKNPNISFVIDETYLLFRKDFNKISMIDYAQKLKNLFVVVSLSKFYAIPGIRMAFLVSSPINIKKMEHFRTPYSYNPFLGKILPQLLINKEYEDKTKNFYFEMAIKFYEDLKKAFEGRLKPLKPEANFIFAKILTNQKSDEIEKELKRHGILVRSCTIYKGLDDKWIRFGIKNETDNKKLILELNKILK